MFAFLRVIVFYLGFAALLTWGMFALGWADALEFPGFEGTPAATPPVPVSTVPARQAQPEPTRDVKPAAPPSEIKVEAKSEPQKTAIDTPTTEPRKAAPVVPPLPPARTDAAPPAADPPRMTELPKPAPPAQPAQQKDPVVAIAPVSPPPRGDVAVAQPRPAPAAPPQARAASPSDVGVKAGVVWHRIAGFGPDALIEQFEDTRRARDDIACVMFRNVTFKAGTTVYQPRARAELDLLAKVLREFPDHRVEVGSRLGPGRPMVTDAKLRTDRASLVRQSLIGLGVAPARLLVDTGEAYERVADDVGRVNGGRAQSIGLCVYP